MQKQWNTCILTKYFLFKFILTTFKKRRGFVVDLNDVSSVSGLALLLAWLFRFSTLVTCVAKS